MGVMRSTSDQPPALTHQTPPPSVDSDYDSIHAAVMETVRGRWFLAEYARRNRSADTDVLLKAIGRIESFIEDQVHDQIQEFGPETIPSESNDNQPASLDNAPVVEPFFAPKDKLATANADLVLVRERLQSITDSLIECGAPTFLTNDLKRRLDDISGICVRLDEIATVAQPGAGDDIVAAAEEGSSLDAHVRAMSDQDPSVQDMSVQGMSIGETAILTVSAEPEVFIEEITVQEISVQEIAVMASQDDAPCEAIVLEPEPLPEPQVQRDPFADIRALSAIEKIALFT